MRLVTFTLQFLFAITFSCAQNESYINYSSKDGLPGNVIYAICEDNQGYIWIGSASGLSRFDGTYFTNYSIKDGIPDNEILKLEKDRQGRIWMLGYNGKIAYIEHGKIIGAQNVPLLKKAKLKGSPCFFHQTPQNDIEITDQKGFVIILKFHANRLKSVTTRDQKAMFSIKTKKNRLTLFHGYWTTGNERFTVNFDYMVPIIEHKQSILLRTKNQITALTATGATCILPIAPQHKIRQITIDSSNHLWYFDEYDQTIKSYDLHKKTSVVTKYHFPYHFNKFFIDSYGNSWVCSQNEGLFFYPKKWLSSKQITVAESPITALHYASNGYLITGNSFSEISFFDPRNLQMVHHIKRNQDRNARKIHTPVYGFKVACNGMICAYSNVEDVMIPCRYAPTQQLKLIDAKDISTSCQGTMLIAKWNSLQKIPEIGFENRQVLTTFRNYAVCYISDQEYWCSDVFGLHCVKDNIKKRVQTNSEIFSNRIKRIEQLSDGNLLLLTDGVGCGVLNRKTRRPIRTQFTRPDVNDYRDVYIRKDTIWLATNNGILALKYGNQTLKLIRKIGTSDGLMSNDVLAVTCSENDIYASTPEGLSKLNKSTLLSVLAPPKLIVNNISIDGSNYSLNSLSVDAIPNEIIIQLSALHFGSRAPLEFAYSINNGENWNTSNSPQILLQNISDGDFSVLLRARKMGGQWSEIQQVKLSIPTPFFKLVWVQVLLIVLLMSLAIWFTILYSGRIRKKQLAAKDIQITLADLELKSLRSMMNTHFVFNALNSIQQFILENNPLEANRYLGKFSRLMRNHLHASIDAQISLKEELQSLEHYLALEKLRLGDRFEYRFIVPETIPELEIPGFILQPLAENAIWHGIMPLDRGGKVEIIVHINQRELQVQIRDNGVGLKPSQQGNHKSRGLKMIHKRLEILTNRTGRRHSLHLQNRSELDDSSGVIASVTIILS